MNALTLPSRPSSSSALSALASLVATVLPAARSRAVRLDESMRALLVRRGRVLHAAAEALRAAAVVAPGGDAELRAESAASAFALLAVYRDAARGPRAAAALDAVRAVELVLEMRARRAAAPRRAWRTIVAVEAIKAALRIALLVRQGGRVLLPCDEALIPTPEPPVCSCGMQDVPGADKVLIHSGPRSGRKILRLDPSFLDASHAPSFSPHSLDPLDPLFVTAYERRAAWLMRMFTPPGGCPACPQEVSSTAASRRALQSDEDAAASRLQQVLAHPSPRWEHVVAEVLYVLRPLVHLLLIRKYGWKSWKAWSASLAMDAISRQLMADPCSQEVTEERQRRLLLLALYCARSPLFEVLYRAVLQRLERTVRRVPFVGPATGSALDLIRSLQSYWFYTSAS